MSNTSKVLSDFVALDYDNILMEASGNVGGSIILKNVLLQTADSPNQNNRIYPRAILEREIADYIETFVKTRSAMGELDHAESTCIELKNVSHIINEIHWEGDNVVGTLEILSNTPAGSIAIGLMKSKVRIGISSRGAGDVTNVGQGNVMVNDSYKLIGWDLVLNPSVKNAFINEEKESKCQNLDIFNNLVVEFFTEIGR